MAYLDFDFVWSGKFAKLQPATKTILYVLASIASHETGEFYHSASTIAKLAGVGRASVFRAFQELEATEPPILVSLPRPGKTTQRFYCADRNYDPTRLTHETPTRLTHETPPVSPMRHEQQILTRDLETTTDDFPENLLLKLVDQYGKEEVEKRVVVISRMNGKVKNKPGLLVHSLKNGYIPTDKETEDKTQAERKRKAIRMQQEEREERERKLQEMIELEQADPETQARIRKHWKAMDEIFKED